MSRSSYTASERRGILAVAIVTLLIIAIGLGVSVWQEKADAESDIPTVKEYPELIDSVAVKKRKEEKVNSSKNKNKGRKKSKTSANKTKTKKTYRQRSPLDEPV